MPRSGNIRSHFLFGMLSILLSMLFRGGAEVGEGALGAEGALGFAGVAAEEDEPVVGAGTKLRGDVALEVAFDGFGGLALREAQAVGDAEDVGVDGDDGLVVNDGGDDIGGLAADAGQAHQHIDVGGNGAVEAFLQLAGGFEQVGGFAVGVGDAFNQS